MVNNITFVQENETNELNQSCHIQGMTQNRLLKTITLGLDETF